LPKVFGTNGQEDGASPDVQERECSSYCVQHEYTVVEVVQETATGVDSLRWREGMLQVRRLLKSGEANVLVVWKVDRVARDMVDGLLLGKELNKHGARLESVHDGVQESTVAGQMMSAIRYGMASMERDAIVLRTHAGLRERVEQDKMPLVGKYPLFGYRYTYGQGRRIGTQRKTGYEIEPETAAIVQEIYEKVAHRGYSLHRLAREFNARGIPTPTLWLEQHGMLKDGTKGTPTWRWQMLQRIIINPSYTGQHTVFRRTPVKKQSQDGDKPRIVMELRPEGDANTVNLTIPAIVSQELWEQARAGLTARKLDSTRRNQEPEATLLRGGIARCGVCKSPMHVALRHERRIYTCGKRRAVVDTETDVCPGGAFGIRADMVDADVWAKTRDILKDMPHLERLLDSRRAKVMEAWEMVCEEQEREQAEIAELEQQKATLARRMATETDDGIYAMQRAEAQRVNALLAEFQKRTTSTTNRVTNISAIRQRIDDILTGKADDRIAQVVKQAMEIVKSMQPEHVLDTASYQEKREFLNLLGVKVVMYPPDSDFARTNDGKQWDFTFNPESDVTGDTVTRSASTSRTPPPWERAR
jgi:site-specific DNA recombinase